MIRTWFITSILSLTLPMGLVAGELEDALDDSVHGPDCPAQVSFLELRDGDVVPTTFTVQFVITGMEVAPAGVAMENTGHHHILIDLNTLPPLDQPLPMTDQIVHFGGGQTSTELTLEPGEHTLQLLLGDYMHVPHNPPAMSPRITITVVEETEEG
ncbi:MAG TPA: DUF4399 domain-containing protein [Xanthomonadales bacterium]|nr:DUF4399 domain-containing protein [Xanthomonadales bacterium]